MEIILITNKQVLESRITFQVYKTNKKQTNKTFYCWKGVLLENFDNMVYLGPAVSFLQITPNGGEDLHKNDLKMEKSNLWTAFHAHKPQHATSSCTLQEKILFFAIKAFKK